MQIEDLELAFVNTHRIVAGVQAEQWTAPTPCPEWNVRELVNHGTWVVSMFGAALQGRAPDSAPDADLLGADAAASFANATEITLEAWRAHGMEGTLQLRAGEVPANVGLLINVTDTYVHGWDIAQATGQDPGLDRRLCAAMMEVMPAAVPKVRRGENFGAEVPVPVDASPQDRLVGFLGRKAE